MAYCIDVLMANTCRPVDLIFIIMQKCSKMCDLNVVYIFTSKKLIRSEKINNIQITHLTAFLHKKIMSDRSRSKL